MNVYITMTENKHLMVFPLFTFPITLNLIFTISLHPTDASFSLFFLDYDPCGWAHLSNQQKWGLTSSVLQSQGPPPPVLSFLEGQKDLLQQDPREINWTVIQVTLIKYLS